LVELDKKNIEHKLFSSDFTFEDSSVFKELMTLYPWCSSFTVVYLKSLSNTDDVRFPNELEEYAVQLNSREVIYDLIHGLETKDSASPNSENSGSDAEKNIEVEGALGPVKTPQDQQSNDDELEKMIVSKIVSDHIIDELAEEVENESKIEEELSQFSIPEKEFDDSPKTFSNWLKMGEDSTRESSKKDYLTFEKPKKDFFSAQASAKESLGVKNLPVSETLAKVFESQGNYSMAISTYEQLILIFPEKKIFFADQIKKIKIKIV
tara:strand:- start:411 stop:1205 length:795 start_codon:yes stop_codon:yes gene_type:complete